MSTSNSSTEGSAPTLLEIGWIGRAHGLAGDLTVSLVTDRLERLQPGSVLVTDRGPLTVRSARPDRGRWLVRFEEITGRTEAESWTGLVLRAVPIDDPDTLWVHELVGCRVVTVDGVDRGEVVAVVANPASDLLELEDGSLVPLRFVTAGPAGGVVEVEAPEGLFDL